ncbi:MAG: hypothetical protein NXI21_12975 [Alphaproteobacteria bacterium]|nr:hypothetical protein [Alphaproteobacteria bacterium]
MRQARVGLAAGVLLAAAGCTQIEPTPIERADGLIQFCPNPFNRRHVLLAARRHCAPMPAQPLGFETCPDEPLVDGWVFACRYAPDYQRLEIESVGSGQAPLDPGAAPLDPSAPSPADPAGDAASAAEAGDADPGQEPSRDGPPVE